MSVTEATAPAARRRITAVVFVTLFVSFAWFDQGAGWNQNTRFNQVRALVEGARWEVNRYCTYTQSTDSNGMRRLRRYELDDAFVPAADLPAPNGYDIAIYPPLQYRESVATGKGSRIYPNKPPGTTILAAPGWWICSHIMRAAGVDLDDWWGLTLAHYLVSVFSVGLSGAVGGVLYLLLVRRMFPQLPEWSLVAATLALFLGTPLFPFSTMLFDHVPVAALLLGSYLLMFIALQRSESTTGTVNPVSDLISHDSNDRAWLLLVASGFVCGFAVVTSYASLFPFGVLTIFLAIRDGKSKRALWFLIGGAVPGLFLMWYHWHCFNSPFAIANNFQPSQFKSANAKLLGVFDYPSFEVALNLLFMRPNRGLFTTGPIFLAVPFGWYLLCRYRELRAHAVVVAAIFGCYLLMNSGFNGWHGGHGFGPRYMIASMPLLALPLPLVFAKLRYVAGALAAVSVALVFMATTVNPQVPSSLSTTYVQYHWHLLTEKILRISDTNGDTYYMGPVSCNPAGVYEATNYTMWRDNSHQARWNSFNLGEFVRIGSWRWAHTIWSVVPLVALWLAMFTWLWRLCRRHAAHEALS